MKPFSILYQKYFTGEDISHIVPAWDFHGVQRSLYTVIVKMGMTFEPALKWHIDDNVRGILQLLL